MITEHTNKLDPAKWVDNYADLLYRYASSRINNPETARDLVQDVFLAALEKVSTFEGRSTERTWLTSILRHKIIDIYRKNKSATVEAATLEKDDADHRDFFETNGHWTDKHSPISMWAHEVDIIRSKEFEKILEKCMEKLPGLWMSVFTMKHINDESTKIICETLNISQPNYWAIIHRAKLNLRECLQKNWI